MDWSGKKEMGGEGGGSIIAVILCGQARRWRWGDRTDVVQCGLCVSAGQARRRWRRESRRRRRR